MPIYIDALKCLLCLQLFVIYLQHFFFFLFTCQAEVVDILKRNNKRTISRRKGIFKLPLECPLYGAQSCWLGKYPMLMKRNHWLTLECKQISLGFLGRLPAHIISPLAKNFYFYLRLCTRRCHLIAESEKGSCVWGAALKSLNVSKLT